MVQQAKEMGPGGYALVALGYAAWVTVGLPASVVSLGAAFTFGFWGALVIVAVGANLGSAAGFLVARHLGREWFSRMLEKRVALAQFNEAIVGNAWKIVLLTRMSPILPFSLLNYAYGLTSIRFGPYVSATALGLLPGSAAFLYFGVAVGEAALGGGRERTPLEWGIFIGGLAVTIVLAVYIVRLARKAMAGSALGKSADDSGEGAGEDEPR